MSEFRRLAPFIQKYIWNQGWIRLRPIQENAIRTILGTNGHVLLAAATASGKTEAALYPVLTDLHANPSTSTGVMYIGPLKALINDQFERLNELLGTSDIRVTAWHGDVTRGPRRVFLDNPQGILQTTPESLQGFFEYRSDRLMQTFHDLRYIVIDEVHAFMGSDRGRQLLCLIERLERTLNITPRRIGLSATLGDYQQASEWLSGNTGLKTHVIEGKDNKRDIEFSHIHEVLPAATPNSDAKNHSLGPEGLHRLYDFTKSGKSLVFAGSRGNTELIVHDLRVAAKQRNAPDIYHVHHGSISKEIRYATEETMRNPSTSACTVATATLELGIDLGQLDRVVQVGAPITVSSFVQRLGRCGRRGEKGWMLAFTQELGDSPTDITHAPWSLLQMVAIAQLYFKHRWVEPIPPASLPLSLLYHQTLSIVRQYTELTPARLAQKVLSLSPFARVTHAQYQTFLRHLIQNEHLQKVEEGTVIVGLRAEGLLSHFSFLATFQERADYEVVSAGKPLGTLQEAPPDKGVFLLAGTLWQVEKVNHYRKTVHVIPAHGTARALWRGGIMDIHTRVIAEVQNVLASGIIPTWVRGAAGRRITETAELARSLGITSGPALVPTSKQTTLIFPWVGSRGMRALVHALGDKANVINAYVIDYAGPKAAVRRHLADFAQHGLRPSALSGAYLPRDNKYDWAAPHDLFIESYMADRLDVAEARKAATALMHT